MTKTIRKPVLRKASPSRTTVVTKSKTKKARAGVASKRKNKAEPARKASRPNATVNTATPMVSARLKIKPGTKTDILITLLKRNKGATTEEMMAASGWQKHSVRGFLAGTVKKKLGTALATEQQDDGQRRYRIVNGGA